MDDVLNIRYVTTTQEDADLFTENHKLMHSIFERTLLTDQGKAVARMNESSFDAQATHTSLRKYYEEDAKVSLDSSTLLTCITTARTYEWKGSMECFIFN